jgi:hypothetical protein
VLGRYSAHGLADLAQPNSHSGLAGPSRQERCASAPGSIPVRNTRAVARAPVVGPRRGLHREHGGGSRVALGKLSLMGSHRVVVSTVERLGRRWQTFADGVSPCGSVDGGAARAPVRDGDGGVPLTAMVVATGGSRRINGKGGVLGRSWSALEAEILRGMEVAVVELSTA